MSEQRHQDSIDFIQTEWAKRLPGQDVSHLGIVGRLARIAGHARARVDANLESLGLSWDLFDLLATVYRWQDRAGGVRPTELYAECLLSSGAMAKRLQHAEAKGLIARRPDPKDGRVSRVVLTKKGSAAAERALPTHIATIDTITGVLSPEDQQTLIRILRQLLISLEKRV